MNNPALEKVLAFLFASSARPTPPADHDRLGLPHTFKPQMGFLEAVVAALGAFLRILLGSTLFAFWGAASLATWAGPRPRPVRIALLIVLLITFAAALALMLLGTRALVRAASPRRPQR